jgi:hypothetical protein
LKAEGICEVQVEPIKNPMPRKDHRVIIEFPLGSFESTRMDMASSKTLVANDGYFDFKNEGTYGSILEIACRGTGQ